MMRSLSPELFGVLLTTGITIIAAFYHMGIRRAQAESTKQGLTLELRNVRENTNQGFGRIEARLGGIEAQLSAMDNRRAESERWQGGVESTLEAQEQRLERLERNAVRREGRIAT